jgi:hypothetical protein
MRTRLKLLTVGLVLVTASVAGCSSTTMGSSGAAQDDATSAPSSGAPVFSTAPTPLTAPAGSTAPTPAPTAVEPSPTPTTTGPPLLGSSDNGDDDYYGQCPDEGTQYSCGDVGPGGGIIVYAVSKPFALSNGYSAACSDNCNYLEAQTVDLPGQYAWCVGSGASKEVSPGTGAAVGTGYSNTQTMATFSDYCSSGAANAALESSFGGYTDWFLPSQDELTLLWDSKALPSLGSFANDIYWSSSQDGDQKAYTQVFDGMGNESQKKSDLYGVRLLRAF